jgi:hypothetical protein
MDVKIIALNCPSCGNSSNVQGKDARFGFHFTCKHCGTQSMLVINQQLYIPQPNEHVCIKCGKVARPGARFCQCRSPLLKRCWSCQSEIPVDDEVCSQCGRTEADYAHSDEKLFLDYVEADIEELKRKKSAGL